MGPSFPVGTANRISGRISVNQVFLAYGVGCLNLGVCPIPGKPQCGPGSDQLQRVVIGRHSFPRKMFYFPRKASSHHESHSHTTSGNSNQMPTLYTMSVPDSIPERRHKDQNTLYKLHGCFRRDRERSMNQHDILVRSARLAFEQFFPSHLTSDQNHSSNHHD